MGSALVVALAKYGLLALLWLFVLIAVRVIREDMFGRHATVGVPNVKVPKPKRRRGVPRTLVVTDGALRGTTLTLSDTTVTLGRGNDCALVLSDDYASTHHARLVPAGDGWNLEDLGSTNGTYLGRNKVSRPTPVPLNTPIRIGKTTLELRS